MSKKRCGLYLQWVSALGKRNCMAEILSGIELAYNQ